MLKIFKKRKEKASKHCLFKILYIPMGVQETKPYILYLKFPINFILNV